MNQFHLKKCITLNESRKGASELFFSALIFLRNIYGKT